MNTYFSKRQEFAAIVEREVFEGLTDSVLRAGLEFINFFDVDESLSLEEGDALRGLLARASRHVAERVELALQSRVLSVGTMRELFVAAESDEKFDALYKQAYETFVEYVDSLNSSDDEDEFDSDDEEGDEVDDDEE